MAESAGSITVQIGGDITAFEAALARAKQQAVAFDAQITAQLSGAGVSEGLARIAAGVDQTNALLMKLTTTSTAAGAALTKVTASTTATTAALTEVAVATKLVNAEMASISGSGGGAAALGAGTIAAKDFAAALEATGGNLSKITPGMLGLAVANEEVAATSKAAAVSMAELGVAETEAAGLGAGVTREFMVLGGEVARGNFSRIPGSLIVMNERLLSTGAGVLTLSNGMKALGALGSVIFNPFVLGFLAITVGAEVAIKAFQSIGGSVLDVNTILENHKKLVDEITGAYPEAAAAAKKYEDQAKLLPQSVVANDATKQIEEDQAALAKSMNGILNTLRLAQGSADAVGTAGADAFGHLADEIEAGNLHAADLARNLVGLKIDPALNDTAKSIAQDLIGASKEAITLQNTLDSDKGLKSVGPDGQKAQQTLFDVSTGFKDVNTSAGSADATIAKLFGTMNAGGGAGVTRSIASQFGGQLTGQLQTTLGMFQQVDAAVQNARQNQLAGMMQLEAQLRATTTEADSLKQALATAGSKDNIQQFFGDVSNIKNANAEIENSVTTVQKLFAAMATGNASVSAVSQGLDMIRQTLINDGFGVDAVNKFIDSLVRTNQQLVADTGQAHQLNAAIQAIQNKTVTITVVTQQVGSGTQSQYQVPNQTGGGTGTVGVTRYSSNGPQVSQTPIFNTSTNSWGYTQPTTYQDPRVLAQVNAMYPGRAAGGPIAANTPYWVGEHGPELVVPSGAGSVIPNAQSTALANPQSAFNGQVATRDTDRMWTVQMNIEANTRKTSQLLDDMKTSSGSSGISASSYSGGSASASSATDDPLKAAYDKAVATWRSNFNAAGIVGSGQVGYGANALAASPEQIAHKAVYGFDSGGMIGGGGGDTQKVEFFKNPNEKVIIARPDQFADVRPGSASGGSASSSSDSRPIVVNQTHNWNGSAPPSQASQSEIRRQTALGIRDALRSVNGR